MYVTTPSIELTRNSAENAITTVTVTSKNKSVVLRVLLEFPSIARLNAAGTIKAMHAKVITLELACAAVESKFCSKRPSLRMVIPPKRKHDPNTTKIFESTDPSTEA
ncbi:687_t:CDS:2, partial [Racocetra fulgida]